MSGRAKETRSTTFLRFQAARLSELVEPEIRRRIVQPRIDEEALRSTLPDIIRNAQDQVQLEYTAMRQAVSTANQDQDETAERETCPPACQAPPVADLGGQTLTEEAPQHRDDVEMGEPEQIRDSSSSLNEPPLFWGGISTANARPEIVQYLDLNQRPANPPYFGTTLRNETQSIQNLVSYPTGPIERTINPAVFTMGAQNPAMPGTVESQATNEPRQGFQIDPMFGLNHAPMGQVTGTPSQHMFYVYYPFGSP